MSWFMKLFMKTSLQARGVVLTIVAYGILVFAYGWVDGSIAFGASVVGLSIMSGGIWLVIQVFKKKD